jgi:hypothetical protein
MTTEGIKLERFNFFDPRSYNPNPDGTWSWGVASEIELMKAVSFDGSVCERLTKKWKEISLQKSNFSFPE